MLLELLKTRRSIRKFEDKEIEKQKIDSILKSALLSPTSRAKRPWEFIVVTDKKLLQKLSQCKEHGSKFLAHAPVGIVVIANKTESDVWIEDASISAIIMQMTALDLELGSCWIQVRKRLDSDNEKSEEYVKQVLQIPNKYSVECIVAMGYPAEDKKSYDERKLLYEKIHHNYF